MARLIMKSRMTAIVLFVFFLSTTSVGNTVFHTVQPGETLSGVANEYNTTIENVLALNDISDPHTIHPGQSLLVALEPAEHVVLEGESLWTIAQQYGVTVNALLLFNDIPNPELVMPGQTLTIPPAGGEDRIRDFIGTSQRETMTFQWPIESGGIITSLFGMRNDRQHKGIDIAVPTGTRVRAAAAGTVTYADWAGTYGMLVMIDHGDGNVTRYAHNSNIVVQVGQHVQKGQHVADVGSTGRSTGPHLHFEIEVNGQLIDPLPFAPANVAHP